MRMYAGGFGRSSFAGDISQKKKNHHVQICVNAQTGQGTLESCPGCHTSGTSTTTAHRPENEDYSRVSSSTTCSLPQTPAETTMTATPTFELAITTAVMNRNRSTTSCLMSVCVRGPLTQRPRFGSLAVDRATLLQTNEKTWKRSDGKPIEWTCHGRDRFNHAVLANLNEENGLD